MCGIAGFVDPAAGVPDREEAVGRMCAAMQHRGPDDGGVATRSGATLGMRRLAIFDPANGRQPMQSPDGRFTVVFNGAIYNFRALREVLAPTGWAFRTQCDTEVLLAAFAAWGEHAVERLRGMFAFAIWDERDRTLTLARDPFGIKPLYYRHTGMRLLFASELNALAASGVAALQLDPGAVADYLAWFAVPAPRTIYRDCLSLRPGECATWRDGHLTKRMAWSFSAPATAPSVCRTREEFSRGLRAQLEDTMRVHSAADVPVGAFLSGGLDSAAVVGLMARTGGSPLRTFSIAFAEPGYSETREAEETARHFGTQHTTRVLSGAEVAGDVEKIVGALDQPTGDGVNTYYASATARAGGVKVALSGLGGDELFGGYPSFRDLPRLSRWLPAWHTLPRFARRAVTSRLARGDTRRRKLADVLAHARTRHEVGALHRRVFPTGTQRALLAPGLASRDASPFHPELASLAADLRDAGDFETASAWELRTYMTDVLLRDSDVMSMRHSLELRVPLVDRVLVEWLWRQPAGFKAGLGQPKSALFEALRDVLPPGLADRRKHGFALPFALWMKAELKPFLDETFSDASIGRTGFLARPAVQQFWQGFLAGRDEREWSRVWSLAVLIAFANRRPGAFAPAPAPAPVQITPAAPRLAGRTLLLAPEIFASEGGIPRILQGYLKALCDLTAPGGAVRLVALNDREIAPTGLRAAGDCLESARGCGRSKPRFIAATLDLARGCDLIVCGHVAQLPVAWLAQKLNPKLRYVLVAHGIEVWRSFNAAERLALRGAERVLCVSDYTRRELLRRCPLPDGRAVVLHNTLDPQFRIEAGRSLAACPPVILLVTRLTYDDRYKGVEDMIAAMPAIRGALPSARLRIVGRGNDLARLQGIAARLGVADSVEFLGYIDDAGLTAELRSCRLFALPSKKEGFGLVFLEAMAHGRPCLGARAGGVPEVITADTGVLVSYGDVPGIAAAAIRALRHPWDQTAILTQAEAFSFPRFREKLGALLQP